MLNSFPLFREKLYKHMLLDKSDNEEYCFVFSFCNYTANISKQQLSVILDR